MEFNRNGKILTSIRNFFPDITIILISHRDKSLEICDEVIKF